MKFITPTWPAPKTVKAYTTLRAGWDTPIRRGNHEAGRELQTLLNLPAEPVWLDQIHSTEVVQAIPENHDCKADATFANAPNQICAILTADCLPILICNQSGTQVAAIHAGWRGLAHGVVENTLAALNAENKQLLVWLGPAIGPNKFEVGKDVYDAFTARHAESARAFTAISDTKWLGNLYELAKIRLHLAGVSHIYGGDYCTYTQDDLFFSYRRDQGKTGRIASLIWIEP